MTHTLYYTVGLPASGKTTKAKEMVDAAEGKMVRVNKDDLRAMLHDGKWSKEREKVVLEMRDAIIDTALAQGMSVIVDDTNFESKHAKRFAELAHEYVAQVERLDFTDVPLKTCLERNKNRERVIAGRDVPEEVIQRMWRQYVKPKTKAEPQDPGLPPCIICDIDGTIATMNGRGPFDWDKVGTDMPRLEVIDSVTYLSAVYEESPLTEKRAVFFLSGRDESCREQTEEWLRRETPFRPPHLLMRPAGSMERDSVVKRRLYEDHIKGKYRVIGVFDDRKQVIRELWEPLGFTVFNVGRVDEEF